MTRGPAVLGPFGRPLPPPDREEERERLFCRMAALKRVLDAQLRLLVDDPEDAYQEFVATVSRLFRVERILMSLARLLSHSSAVVWDSPIEARMAAAPEVAACM